MSNWSRPEILQLANILGTIIVAVLGYMAVRIGRINHVTMNSRLSQLLESSKAVSRAEGVSQGLREKK